jgi:hypothetical protein
MMENSICYKALNQQGLIPGPREQEAEFLQRVQFCQQLEQELTSQVANFPFSDQDRASKKIVEEAFHLTQSLYDITPSWVPLFFSNYQLTPWHGGCAWIFQLTEQTPVAAFLQLRSRFRHSSTYLRLYRRQELLAHEFAHVGRMMYQEPQFEEVLAYQTSSSAWRRWLGPIIQSARESLLFILLLSVILMAHFAIIHLPYSVANPVSLFLTLFLLGCIVLAFGRLIRRHWHFNRTLSRLTELYQNPQTARHVLYRLQDHEIKKFSRLSPQQIGSLMKKAQQESFRWSFILQNYPIV